MPTYAVPRELKHFEVAKGSDGSHVVVARDDRRFVIPCRDADQAGTVRDRLNAGDHDGTVQVDLLGDDQAGRISS